MAIQIQLRNGLAAQWTLANPILAIGEFGLETDTGLFKIGNGGSGGNGGYAVVQVISSSTSVEVFGAVGVVGSAAVGTVGGVGGSGGLCQLTI